MSRESSVAIDARPEAAVATCASAGVGSQQALLVLGMHRSGTSAVGGVLAGLGARMPRTPMGATSHNPRGYFESAELVRFHDRMLRAQGGSWRDWGAFDRHWLETPDGRAHVAEACELLSREFDDARLLLIKEPRICRFVPLWLAALDRLRIAPKVIIPVRHPLEVAQSLSVRNGFGLERSLLLWLRHVLDAEADTRTLPRAVVSYDDLLRDWRGQAARMAQALQITWPTAPDQADVDAYLCTELRHHRTPSVEMRDTGPLAGWVEDTYRALLALRDPDAPPSARAALDTVRQALDLASVPFAAVSREQQAELERDVAATRARSADRIHVLEVELKRVRTALAKQTAALETTQVQAAGLAAEAARHHAQLLARESELTGRHTELDALKRATAKTAADTAQRLRRLRGRLGGTGTPASDPGAVFNDLDARVEALLKRQTAAAAQRALDAAQLARQAAELHALRAQVRRVTGSLTWRLSAPLRRAAAALTRHLRPDPRSTQAQLIRQSEWFDAPWYAREYPDVADSGLDPARHYLEFGATEGRNPGPRFDTRHYLASYAAVIAPGENPLLHFLSHGQQGEFRPHPAA